jgi:hypothetical protein
MKSSQRGRSTSVVEVTNVSRHGFWLLIAEKERFISFEEFPWFRDATIRELTNVELPAPHHLYWPDLDVDVAVESIDHPERYPLVSAAQPNKRLHPTAAVREGRAKYTTPRKRRRG